MLNDLRKRGVQNIPIIVRRLQGLSAGYRNSLLANQVQACIVHNLRHSMSFVSYKDRQAVATALKTVYAAVDAVAAEAALSELRDSDLAKRY